MQAEGSLDHQNLVEEMFALDTTNLICCKLRVAIFLNPMQISGSKKAI